MSATRTRRQILQSAALWLPGAALATSACRSETASAAAPAARGERAVRAVAFVMDTTPTLEGAGVRLRRSVGTRELSLLNGTLVSG